MAEVDGSQSLDARVQGFAGAEPPIQLKPYIPERQRDWVRTLVTLGLLVSFSGLIYWACRQSVSSAAQWAQTKEMLQILLPAITGLLGSVIGFYFGSGAGTTMTQK